MIKLPVRGIPGSLNGSSPSRIGSAPLSSADLPPCSSTKLELVSSVPSRSFGAAGSGSTLKRRPALGQGSDTGKKLPEAAASSGSAAAQSWSADRTAEPAPSQPSSMPGRRVDRRPSGPSTSTATPGAASPAASRVTPTTEVPVTMVTRPLWDGCARASARMPVKAGRGSQ